MRFFSILIICVLAAASVQADTIRKACLGSDRGAGQRSMCSCIQGAADQTLSNKDQRVAARFFKNPEVAQKMRRSDRRRDESFWERYEQFGKRARRACAR